MVFCRILKKVSNIPKDVTQYLSEDDIVFSWANRFLILVSDSKPSEVPVNCLADNIIRLDKRVLRDLNDQELAIVFRRCEIEEEIKGFLKNQDLIEEAVDDVIGKLYTRETLDLLNQKLIKIYEL